MDASSPRERGSSVVSGRRDVDGCVVPARAGVILAHLDEAAARGGRPRASGGHPGSGRRSTRPTTSSPRERGSSGGCTRSTCWRPVVPARAGVILDSVSHRYRRPRRPRASRGHPPVAPPTISSVTSSPRERGSSSRRIRVAGWRPVVPARAGVIPSTARRTASRPCRPRASGGHPGTAGCRSSRHRSSPRERGSSYVSGGHGPFPGVVPARAGVIPAGRSTVTGTSSRPRASGGHPRYGSASADVDMSSPRERGSSGLTRTQGARWGVVPARAGVILISCAAGSRKAGRPRASGGHPPGSTRTRRRSLSSPRERGSSSLAFQSGARMGVVPARAGVIRVDCGVGGGDRCRPRASGGHPTACPGDLSITLSSPRERGSSRSLRRRRRA